MPSCYPYLSDVQQLATDDIQGVQALYGPPVASVISIGANQQTVSGSLSGPPATVFGGTGALDFTGGSGLVVLDTGSARVHDGIVTVFAGSAALAASNNYGGEFILRAGYSSTGGNTMLRFADGSTITLKGVSDPSGGGLSGATLVG